MLAEAPDGLHQLRHAPAVGRHGFQNRRPPRAAAIALQREVRFHCAHETIGALAIRFVHDEDIGDLHDARLERLHFVAGAGDERHDRHVGRANDIDLVLPDADRLDDDEVLPRRVEDERGVAGGAREAAEVTARRHAADEHRFVGRMRLHPQSIAKHRAAAERTRRVDRNHTDGWFWIGRPPTEFRDQTIDQCALAGAGRAGDADQVGASGVREDGAHQVGARSILVFDERDGARDSARIAGEHSIGESLAHRERSWRAMTSRWISLVPSPIVVSFTSRKYFSAG